MIETVLNSLLNCAQSGPPLPANLSDGARDFLQRTFECEPQNRPTCTQLLQHPFVCL